MEKSHTIANTVSSVSHERRALIEQMRIRTGEKPRVCCFCVPSVFCDTQLVKNGNIEGASVLLKNLYMVDSLFIF